MLNEALSQYVELHRSLGFKFRVQRLLLANFVRFAERHGDEFIRVARVIEWAVQAPSPPQRRNRLLTARRFALSLQAEDPRHEVPTPDAIGRRLFRRRTPYIYTPGEVAALMKAAAGLRPSGSIRPLMYSTLFGLIAATGMRIFEALALRLEDVTDDGLVVRETKFHKSRLLPLHDTTRRALASYLSVRRRLGTLDGALFVSNTSVAPAYPTVVATFLRLARLIGLRGATWRAGAQDPRPPTQLRRTVPRSLPCRSGSCRPPHRRAQHLSRPRPRHRHVLVSRSHAGPDAADRTGQ